MNCLSGQRMSPWVAMIVCGAVSLGCAAPVPYLKGDSKYPKAGTWEQDETPMQYCSRLSTTADSNAQLQLGFGIAMGLMASAAVVAGAAMGPSPDADADWLGKNRNTLVLGAGGLLAVPTTILLMRSQSSSTASAAAGLAMGQDNAKARELCLQARSDFVNARTQLADVGLKSIQEQVASNQALKKEKDKEATDLEAAAEKAPTEAKKNELLGSASAARAVSKALDEKNQQLLKQSENPK